MNPYTFNAPHAFNTSVRADSRQALVLERADVAPCPFGEVGNRQYTASQGGTARASAAGVAFSHAFNSLGNFVVNQAHSLNFVSNETRARYEDLLKAYDNSLPWEICWAT
ncbi:hypothetical protein [Alcaligenes sp. Marseille-Q7550]